MSNTAPSEWDEQSRLEAAGEWLLRLRDTETSEETVARWIEWCDADERNLHAFEELQSLWTAAARHPPAPADLAMLLRPDDFATARAPMRRENQRPASPMRWSAIAATLVTIGTLGVVLAGKFGYSVGPDKGVLHAGALDSINTPLAMNQAAVLPDGSQVDLGARSALDVEFTGNQRHLELRTGQAFFRVKHDTHHPFVVEAGPVRVMAVGTAFDVRRTGTQVTVTVQEGTVEVTNETDVGAIPLRATVGYQLMVDSSTGATRRSIVDPQMASAWRSGRLEFAGDSLATVIASVNRYSVQPIVLGDPALAQLTFTGTVFVDAIDASLDAMQQVFPLRVQRSAHEIMVVRRDR